eukprot:768313-Hanusia_phi.AAC.1
MRPAARSVLLLLLLLRSSKTTGMQSLAPELYILLPRDGETVRSEDGIGVALLFQVLGVDLEEEGVVVEVQLDGRVVFNTSQISGRVLMREGEHRMIAQLLPRRPATAGQGEGVSRAEARFFVSDPERLPQQRTQSSGHDNECLMIGTVRVGAREGSGTDGEMDVRVHGAGGTRTVILRASDGVLQESSRSCFAAAAPCAVWPLTHAEVTHRTSNGWRGLFVEDVEVRGINCSLCNESGQGRLGACSFCLTSKRSSTDSSCASELLRREEEEEEAARQSHWEGSVGAPALFVCNRWFDEESGSSGVCPSLELLERSSESSVAVASSCTRASFFRDQDKWVTNSRLGVSGMMGNQLFQLAALIAFAHRHPGMQVCRCTNSSFTSQPCQVVIPDIPWSGREQERLRVFELLAIDLPLMPVRYLQVRVQSTWVERHFHYDEQLEEVRGPLRDEMSLICPTRWKATSTLTSWADFKATPTLQTARRRWNNKHVVRSRMQIRPELRRRAAAVVSRVRTELGSQLAKGAAGGFSSVGGDERVRSRFAAREKRRQRSFRGGATALTLLRDKRRLR